MTKMSPCCARKVARVGQEKANLTRVARRAAKAPESARWQAEIARAKASLQNAEDHLVDHEADHAAGTAA